MLRRAIGFFKDFSFYLKAPMLEVSPLKDWKDLRGNFNCCFGMSLS